MAKFKVGDKVTDGEGVYLITGIDKDFDSYEWKFVSGRKEPSHSKGGTVGWADGFMKIANACNSANPVVAKAMNACAKNGDNLISYTTDAYGYVPKVGDVYLYDGKRVKCTGVSKLSPGSGGIDRYQIEAKSLNACARNGEDVAAILGIAESDIKDGDIDDAREALRDIREAAMRKGWGGEWRKLASKVGLNASGTAKNYTRDTEAFRKRGELEKELNGIVQKFVNDIKAVGRKAAREYARLKKTDREAFWVDEVTGWTESLENAVNDAW